jgi:hypothetical protein
MCYGGVHAYSEPILPTTEEAEAWLGPGTDADRAFARVDQYPGDRIRIAEAAREMKPAA